MKTKLLLFILIQIFCSGIIAGQGFTPPEDGKAVVAIPEEAMR